MLRCRIVHGKNLVHRNLKELSVEFKLYKHMVILLILLPLIYAPLNPGKITVKRLSIVEVTVKF